LTYVGDGQGRENTLHCFALSLLRILHYSIEHIQVYNKTQWGRTLYPRNKKNTIATQAGLGNKEDLLLHSVHFCNTHCSQAKPTASHTAPYGYLL